MGVARSPPCSVYTCALISFRWCPQDYWAAGKINDVSGVLLGTVLNEGTEFVKVCPAPMRARPFACERTNRAHTSLYRYHFRSQSLPMSQSTRTTSRHGELRAAPAGLSTPSAAAQIDPCLFSTLQLWGHAGREDSQPLSRQELSRTLASSLDDLHRFSHGLPDTACCTLVRVGNGVG